MKKTDLYILLDSSGSMTAKTKMVVSAVNEFLNEQQQEQGECLVSFYTFSRQLRCLYEKKDIQTIAQMKEEEFEPYGTTALWDAMAGVLDKIPILDNKEKDNHLQILVILTDGEENNSRQYKPIDLKEKIQEREGLEIVYVGSNQDAVLNGNMMGGNSDSSLEYIDEKLNEAVRATSSAVKRYRSGHTPRVLFTPMDRENST